MGEIKHTVRDCKYFLAVSTLRSLLRGLMSQHLGIPFTVKYSQSNGIYQQSAEHIQMTTAELGELKDIYR